VECLEGHGPQDLRELVCASAAHLLLQTNKASNLNDALRTAESCLASGRPREKWNEMLAAQGADLAAFDKKLKRDHTAPVVMELKASHGGFVKGINARIIGEVVRDLGGGRLTKETVIQPDVGVDRLPSLGDIVSASSILCRVHAADKSQAEAALARLNAAFTISDQPPENLKLIHEIITG
jgi:thymidine phosphorylase